MSGCLGRGSTAGDAPGVRRVVGETSGIIIESSGGTRFGLVTDEWPVDEVPVGERVLFSGRPDVAGG